MTDRPLSADEFAATLIPLLPPGADALALAVSGGRDSMALLHLSADVARSRNVRLLALTVDHGLRPESANEAQGVARAAGRLGVSHRILRWQGQAQGNLEARAREARYRLLAEACAEAGVGVLAVAHTLEDQAETVLLRLSRGSGVDGLAGMAPRTQRLGLTLVRPLLDIARARLTATLLARQISWFDDPMNEDERFARVALRKAEHVLASAGLTTHRLAATARHMARARAALEEARAACEARAVSMDAAGYARLDVQELRAVPEEIRLRVLARLLMRVGGLFYPPRFAGLERLYHAVIDETGGGRTLGGCLVLPAGQGKLLIVREPSALAPRLPLIGGRVQIWDGRFKVRLPEVYSLVAHSAAAVGALGPEGLRILRKKAPGALPRIAAAARESLPSLWLGDELAAVPHLGYADGGRPALSARFEAAFTGL